MTRILRLKYVLPKDRLSLKQAASFRHANISQTCRNILWYSSCSEQIAPTECLTPGRCHFTSGRTIWKSREASPDTILCALLPSVLHKSRHAPLVICSLSQCTLLVQLWIREMEKRKEGDGVGLQTGVKSHHTAEGLSQMCPKDLQPSTPPNKKAWCVCWQKNTDRKQRSWYWGVRGWFTGKGRGFV